MKKIIYSFLLLGCALFSFSACEDETSQDHSVITYYATLDIVGDAMMFWDLNTPYVDPGYVSEMQGEDVTDQVVVIGKVDYNTPGIYNLEYRITNKDGFAVTASRTVMVADSTPSPIESGYWTCSPSSYRNSHVIDEETGEVTATTTTAYGSAFDVVLLQLAPGHFYISDFLGGWYDQRAGYGAAYAMVGEFQLNDDNTLTALDSSVAGWGDSMDKMEEAKYDPATGSISYKVTYAGTMDFYVTLTK